MASVKNKSARKKKARGKVKAKAAMKPAARKAGDFYPPIKPYSTGFLKVSPLHDIYYEQSGNPKGKPVVFLHGGPGGGTDAKMRQFFNPKKYRIVLFDQRGCGKSKPAACLEDNTTWHLVSDIEAIREKLGIDKWQVFGGSWGSTLALAYAQKHPERVTELVLRGIFLLRRSELEWFYQNPEGAAQLWPDLWEDYLKPLSQAERADCMQSYYKRLTSPDRNTLLEAARAWSVWESALSYFHMNTNYVQRAKDAEFAAAFARSLDQLLQLRGRRYGLRRHARQRPLEHNCAEVFGCRRQEGDARGRAVERQVLPDRDADAIGVRALADQHARQEIGGDLRDVNGFSALP